MVWEVQGELGIYLIGDQNVFPWRWKIRPPGFVNLQVLPQLVKRMKLADIPDDTWWHRYHYGRSWSLKWLLIQQKYKLSILDKQLEHFFRWKFLFIFLFSFLRWKLKNHKCRTWQFKLLFSDPGARLKFTSWYISVFFVICLHLCRTPLCQRSLTAYRNQTLVRHRHSLDMCLTHKAKISYFGHSKTHFGYS